MEHKDVRGWLREINQVLLLLRVWLAPLQPQQEVIHLFLLLFLLEILILFQFFTVILKAGPSAAQAAPRLQLKQELGVWAAWALSGQEWQALPTTLGSRVRAGGGDGRQGQHGCDSLGHGSASLSATTAGILHAESRTIKFLNDSYFKLRKLDHHMLLIAYQEECQIRDSKEDLALGPGTRLDHSRGFM